MEMFAFCEEESQYYGKMQQYFEKFGHKPPFGDDDEDFPTWDSR